MNVKIKYRKLTYTPSENAYKEICVEILSEISALRRTMMLCVYMILLMVYGEEGLGARNSRIVRVKQGKLQGIVVGEFTITII